MGSEETLGFVNRCTRLMEAHTAGRKAFGILTSLVLASSWQQHKWQVEEHFTMCFGFMQAGVFWARCGREGRKMEKLSHLQASQIEKGHFYSQGFGETFPDSTFHRGLFLTGQQGLLPIWWHIWASRLFCVQVKFPTGLWAVPGSRRTEGKEAWSHSCELWL